MTCARARAAHLATCSWMPVALCASGALTWVSSATFLRDGFLKRVQLRCSATSTRGVTSLQLLLASSTLPTTSALLLLISSCTRSSSRSTRGRWDSRVVAAALVAAMRRCAVTLTCAPQCAITGVWRA